MKDWLIVGIYWSLPFLLAIIFMLWFEKSDKEAAKFPTATMVKSKCFYCEKDVMEYIDYIGLCERCLNA